MLKWLGPLAVLTLGTSPLVTSPLAAQSEIALKEYFEGRTVTVKQAMPGTEDGVDIYPGTDRPLDYPKYAARLKQYGTALKAGESVMVTKVKIKPKHIEFQLGGGGYGTMGDETSTSVNTQQAPKTKREKNLEAELKREADPVRKRAMQEELDDLKAEREREDSRNRASVAEAEEHRKQNVRQRRLEGGSRFNIRYRDRVPSEALDPAAVMAALAPYVDFQQIQKDADQAVPKERPAAIHKGMLTRDTDALFGAPVNTSERKEGTLSVLTREYSTPDGRITAEFVEGVLIRYTIKSE